MGVWKQYPQTESSDFFHLARSTDLYVDVLQSYISKRIEKVENLRRTETRSYTTSSPQEILPPSKPTYQMVCGLRLWSIAGQSWKQQGQCELKVFCQASGVSSIRASSLLEGGVFTWVGSGQTLHFLTIKKANLTCSSKEWPVPTNESQLWSVMQKSCPSSRSMRGQKIKNLPSCKLKALPISAVSRSNQVSLNWKCSSKRYSFSS